jgi:hypothetical protein
MEDSSPTQPQELHSLAGDTLLSIGAAGSLRSPVSPWKSSPNVSGNLNAGYRPVYYEMEASGPVEMPGSLVHVAEKVGSPVPDSPIVPVAQEESGGLAVEGKGKPLLRKSSTEKTPGMLLDGMVDQGNVAGKENPTLV